MPFRNQSNEQSVTDIYVQGIPIELDNKGLMNIFSKAGKIEFVKIIPAKDTSQETTYGFVRYKTRTAAATAFEMFQNYKFGSKYLIIRYANQQSNNNYENINESKSNQKFKQSNEDLNDTFVSSSSKRSSIGRGSLIQQEKQKTSHSQKTTNGRYDLSRPYARRICSRRFSIQSNRSNNSLFNENDVNNNTLNEKKQRASLDKILKSSNIITNKNKNNQNEEIVNREYVKNEKLEIGDMYKINITHFNSPTNFFVQLVSSIDNTANLMNNLDNYYRNGLHKNTTDLKEVNFQINDWCAAFYDSFWYRAQIVSKYPEKRTYHLRIVDFGDIQELPYENVTYLYKEFCKTSENSIRCKLSGIRPLNGCKEWAKDALSIFDTILSQSEESLYIKVIDCEDYDRASGRFENIYAVDLLYGGVDSVTQYLIENNYAVQIDENDSLNFEQSVLTSYDLIINKNHNSIDNHHHHQHHLQLQQQNKIFNNKNNLNCSFTSELTVDESIDFTSVSMLNLCDDKLMDENLENLKNIFNPHNRNKMFNSVFKVWKKKDLKPCIQSYKCGQILDVNVCYVHESKEFYIQEQSRLNDLEYVEACIQNYARVLLEDNVMFNEYKTYQDMSNKFDLVLVKSDLDHKWRRAVYLEKMTSEDLHDLYSSDEDEFSDYDEKEQSSEENNFDRSKKAKSFFKFYLIDWGREEMIVRDKMNLTKISDLFILPFNEKLIQLGAFVLKCTINENQIKFREKLNKMNKIKEMNELRRTLFDKKFKSLLEKKTLRMRVSQIVNIKNELEATVDLYFLPEESNLYLKKDDDQKDQLTYSNINKSSLNCVQYILDEIKLIEDEEFKKLNNKNEFIKKDSSHKDYQKTLIQEENMEKEEKEDIQANEIDVISEAHSQSNLKQTEKEKLFESKTCLRPNQIINNYEKLNKSQSYLVNIQYYDESLNDPFFHISLNENFDKMEKLQAFLQETNGQFLYVDNLNKLNKNDVLEGLYDLDSKWYRVLIKHIDSENETIQIHFLDYGNTEIVKFESLSEKILRFRLEMNNSLLKMDYQAIKCRYKNENDLKSFLQNLSMLDDFENGFRIKIQEIIQDHDEKIYIIDLKCIKNNEGTESTSSESSTDKEVSNILEENENIIKPIAQYATKKYSVVDINDSSLTDPNLKENSTYQVSVVHFESVNQFYVQTSEHLKAFIDNQEKIKYLIENLLFANSSNINEKYKVGEYVFAKYELDMIWYRGVVIDVEFNHELNDYLYKVYFTDYGNTQASIQSNNLYSIQSIQNLYSENRLNLEIEDLNSIIKLPYQAICCQLIDKKTNTRNNEIFKNLISECFNFEIKIVSHTKQTILNIENENIRFEINKYLVNLSTEDQVLDDKFESSEVSKPKISQKQQQEIVETKEKVPKIVDLNKKSLEINKIFEAKTACFENENEIYLNLIEDGEKMECLEQKLIKDRIESKRINEDSELEIGDLVLAKFYLDYESNYNWYRAIIKSKIKQNNSTYLFQVFFIDYGNSSLDLTLNDLAALPPIYNLDIYPPFAFRIQLNNCQIDLDKHSNCLNEFLDGTKTFNIKILNINNVIENDLIKINQYIVEMWNKLGNKCLNKLINTDYDLNENVQEKVEQKREKEENRIDRTNLSFLYKDNTELKVKINYIFMDNLLKPLYFCLESDSEQRKSLDIEMNSFYSSDKNSEMPIENLKLNSYIAIYSENSWYRAQIKNISENKITLFYIDYGYDEILPIDDNDSISRVKKLDKKFYNYARYAFGAYLLKALNTNYVIEFNNEDNQNLSEVLNEYFENNSNLNESTLIVSSKLNNEDLKGTCFHENEVYFGIEMLNDKNMSLNEMILNDKNKILIQKETKKAPIPAYLKLKLDQMPKQNPITRQEKKYFAFANSIDSFYVFDENEVALVQKQVQEVCLSLLSKMKNYDPNLTQIQLPNKSELVYAKYDDDVTWYRCLITNCDESKTKYELYYLDFGNTEIISSSDVLCGWNAEQMKPFTDFEPKAYHCKLYGLLPVLEIDNLTSKKEVHFTETQNSNFKKFLNDKLFNVNFIKVNDENKNLYEVSLDDIVSESVCLKASAHIYLIMKNQAEFPKFNEIFKTIKKIEEYEFYIQLLKSTKLQE